MVVSSALRSTVGLVLLVHLWGAPLSPAVEPPSAEVREAWSQAALLFFNDAERVVAQAVESKPDDASLAFGRSLLLLNVQPRTRSNIRLVRETLERIAQEQPHSELGILSRYFVARIWQVHAFEPDLPRARALYRALWEAHPQHVFGQRAFLYHALLSYYEPMPVAEKRRRVAELEREAQRLSHPDVRRGFHLVTGEVYARVCPDDAGALRNHVAAHALGIRKRDHLAWTLVRIGSLATRLGDRGRAVEAYREFLERFPRDPTAHLVTLRLAALEVQP